MTRVTKHTLFLVLYAVFVLALFGVTALAHHGAATAAEAATEHAPPGTLLTP